MIDLHPVNTKIQRKLKYKQMDINASYVLSYAIGQDVTSNIATFMQNPEDESRNTRDDALTEHLDACYEIYRANEMKEIARIHRDISRRCYDYDTVLELREQICDIHHEIETVSYEDLMKMYPRVKIHTADIHLHKTVISTTRGWNMESY